MSREDLSNRNAQFDFAMALNEAICDAIDSGLTESLAIAAKVTTEPRIKEFIAAIRSRDCVTNGNQDSAA